MDSESILSMQRITKKFTGVTALMNVDFDLSLGEVHGLVGRNGAGKSTLMNILCGRIGYDAGRITLDGEEVHIRNPQRARELGLAITAQEPEIVPKLSIAENMFLGFWNKTGGFAVNWKDINSSAQKILAKVGLNELSQNVDLLAEELSIGQQQLISIARAFFVMNARIIILDEPTASLPAHEERMLYDLINLKKNEGGSIILISHRLDEIFRACDRVTVLRDGRKISTDAVASLTKEKLIQLIVGREIEKEIEHTEERPNDQEEVLEVRNLKKGRLFHDISFIAKKGEVLGIAGLRGAGRSELFRAIVGIDKADSGSIRINKKPVVIHSPSDALKRGICILPEDREREGIIPRRAILENLSLSSLSRISNRLKFIRWKTEAREVENLINELKIAASSARQPVMFLSGGNKQKVVCGRILMANPILFIFDEPTKGIDIETKYRILNLIKKLKKQAAILVASSELEDLMMVSDRVLVLCRGRITANLPISKVTQAHVISCMEGELMND